MNMRWLSVALICALLVGTMAAPAAGQSSASGYSLPVAGGVEGFAREDRSFGGSLTISSFGAQGSDLLLQGMLDGEIRDASLSPIGNVKLRVAAPVADIAADCDGIQLIVNPLKVDEANSPIVLDAIRIKAGDLGAVTKAQQDLLCNAGRLSDRNLPPAVVARLLNQLMAALSK